MQEQHDFVAGLGYLSMAARLKRISDHMMHGARQVYKTIGLDIEPNWYLVFKLLQQQGTLSITEIGEKLRFSHPSVIGIVKKMKEKGYLESRQDERDTRKQLVYLSVKATQNMPRFEESWKAGEAVIKDILDHNASFLQSLSSIEERLISSDFSERTFNHLKHE